MLRVGGVAVAVVLVAAVVLVVRNAPAEEPAIFEDPYCWSAQPAEPDFAAPPFAFDPVARALAFATVLTESDSRAGYNMLAPEFQVLCGLIAPSHAFVHVAHWGCEVNVHGMVVQDGDLIHADRHGAVVVPLDAVRGVLGKLDLMVRKEAVILEAARRPDATVDMIKDAWQRSTEIRE